MYVALVIAHSWLRWLVLVMVVLALVRAARGAGGGAWTSADDSAGKWFVTALDIQILVGLILYFFLSPYTSGIWSNMGTVMRDPLLRFLAVEHFVGMMVAAAFAHVGRARIRKTSDPAKRHTTALIFFGLSLIVMAGSIPWPFMTVGRPLFRL